MQQVNEREELLSVICQSSKLSAMQKSTALNLAPSMKHYPGQQKLSISTLLLLHQSKFNSSSLGIIKTGTSNDNLDVYNRQNLFLRGKECQGFSDFERKCHPFAPLGSIKRLSPISSVDDQNTYMSGMWDMMSMVITDTVCTKLIKKSGRTYLVNLFFLMHHDHCFQAKPQDCITKWEERRAQEITCGKNMDNIHKLLQFILYIAPYMYLHSEKKTCFIDVCYIISIS